MKTLSDQWANGVEYRLEVREVLHKATSDFQEILVVDTPRLGKVLVLDGHLQTSERDEAGYHEMIVHPGLCRAGARADDQSVLIIGGGDGGAAREALRHPSVSRVDLVDIDRAVMDAAREHLPSIWGGIDDDARFFAHAEDGVAFLEQSERKYEHIVVDASDPVGPGTVLYSDRFYSALRTHLTDSGSVSVQAGSLHYLPEVTQTVFAGLSKHFPKVCAYTCFTEIYPGGLWNLVMATAGGDEPRAVDIARADALEGCAFYDAEAHVAAFALGPRARAALSAAPPALSEVSDIVNALS